MLDSDYYSQGIDHRLLKLSILLKNTNEKGRKNKLGFKTQALSTISCPFFLPQLHPQGFLILSNRWALGGSLCNRSSYTYFSFLNHSFRLNELQQFHSHNWKKVRKIFLAKSKQQQNKISYLQWHRMDKHLLSKFTHSWCLSAVDEKYVPYISSF